MAYEHYNLDDVVVDMTVTLKFSIAIWLFDGPITPEIIAEHVKDQLASADDVIPFIDTTQINEVRFEE